MFFSKSFGYSLRGILYIALLQDENRKIQVDEIAKKLSVPRHFLGKIMQELVRAGMLQSTKGPFGGFSLNDKTLSIPLIRVVEITDGLNQFKYCVLQFKGCDNDHPCPLHQEVDELKRNLLGVLSETTIGDLLHADKLKFIQSLTAR